jgi:hypothetical protein
MNAHPTNALPRTCVDDPDRAMAAARQRPQPRHRRHMTRPRDSLNDIAHATRWLTPVPCPCSARAIPTRRSPPDPVRRRCQMQITAEMNHTDTRREELTSAERRLVAAVKRRKQRGKQHWRETIVQEGFAPFFGFI